MSLTTEVPAGEAHGAGIPDATDPYGLFEAWFAEAVAKEPNDPNAMCLATTTPDGWPSARMVLLKGRDDRGFVFYTNEQSRKGGELLSNPRAALCFHWKSLRRQVRVEGTVERVTTAESDAYFASRSRGSRISAASSDQSRPLPSRAEFERRIAELEARYPGDTLPRPPHWGGFRVLPLRIEFWQDMPFRMHDRLVFERAGEGWTTGRLFP
ncbi:pyridoxamine 5'-phosphate oxidase [Roseomonas sp. SSH11]|uniref:Pyridoxine/pyridoxamine 5'-phosphate oxidase n=1 Tax=Pararoseomonas baculiformis TaxID=2820812 RepID=A0ABS4AK01_9PROT|nr:pyridoxamine 5'-phosphate oxidase [Pararoseomonas baculiformis]MBP0447367.1 pyridoxamine 5'-phosphate oxidase [Pararoseomonas baculiformis]